MLLDSLAVCLDDPAPVLFGVSAQRDNGSYAIFDAVYERIGHEIGYTGGLLLADGFIQELYVHMGFHPA